MTRNKRSVSVAGHRTSVSLETVFWDELARLAKARHVSLNTLIADVDAARTGNLSSALRLFILHTLKTEPASDLSTDE